MEKYQGNLSIDEVVIDADVYSIKTGLCSRIVNKTSNSVEVYNQRATERGINSTNWYALEWFNRYFRYYKEGETKKNFKLKKKKDTTKSIAEIDRLLGEFMDESF